MPLSVTPRSKLLRDFWTMRILDPPFLAPSRFEVMLCELNIARNILPNRLKRLRESGLIESNRPTTDRRTCEYRLAEGGNSTWPIVRALRMWTADQGGAEIRQRPAGGAI